MNADQFNSRYPVGTLVFAYPGCRPEDVPSDRRLVTRTRSKAQVLGGHTDVVWVDGHSACIALSHVDVVTEDEWEKARLAAAVAEQGALPMPAGPEVLDDQRLAEYAELIERTTPVGAVTASPGILDVLLAEVKRQGERIARLEDDKVRLVDQRAKDDDEFVQAIAERDEARMRLSSVLDICDREQRNALRWQDPIPVPEWVAPVQRAALGDDKRREPAS